MSVAKWVTQVDSDLTLVRVCERSVRSLLFSFASGADATASTCLRRDQFVMHRCVVCVIASLMVASCKGPSGPAGPPGPQGARPTAEEINAAVAASDLERRVTALEEDRPGVGYYSLAHSWRTPWVTPITLRCMGPEATPRNFDAPTSRLHVTSAFQARRQPEFMRVSVRKRNEAGGPGEVVFDNAVPQCPGERGFCVSIDLPCTGIFSVGIGNDAPRQ